jgi:hypothetical protein
MKIIFLTTNENSPFPHLINIIEETEKAYKLQNEYKTYSLWIPKKALKLICKTSDCYTFESWFRKIEDGRSIEKAFRLFN